MKFTLPVGDQVRLGDLLDGKLVRPALTFDLDEPALGPADRAGEIASSLHPLGEPDARALPRVPSKISFSPEGPIKPWRAHFELIGVRNQIRDVERRRQVPADPLAVRVGYRHAPLPRPCPDSI